jgi:integrase
METWDTAVESFLNRAQLKYSENYVGELRVKIGLLSRWAAQQCLPLEAFRASHLDKYLAQRQRRVGARSIETDARRARLFFRFCVERGLLERDPLRDYVVVKAPAAAVDKADLPYLQAMLKAIEQHNDVRANPDVKDRTARQRRFIKTRDYAMFTGLIETGCRISELCSLKLSDFDPQHCTVLFRRTKNGEDREVPISGAWISAVKEWLKVRLDLPECDTLFMSENGLPMNKDSFADRWNKYEAFAGLSHETRHNVRRYTITELCNKDIMAAARIAGHKDVKVTYDRYYRPNVERVRAVHEAAAPLTTVLNQQQETSKRRKRV